MYYVIIIITIMSISIIMFVIKVSGLRKLLRLHGSCGQHVLNWISIWTFR